MKAGHSFFLSYLLLVGMTLLARPIFADNAPVKGDVVAGKLKAEDNRCIECHGIDGNGQGPAVGGAGKFAKLAGQYPDYLVKQLRDFRLNIRKHDVMSIMAKSLDEPDLADIAAYFAGQPRMQGDGNNSQSPGKTLFISGDASRGIPACVSCHGNDIKTLVSQGPIIAGQEWQYLEKQLQDWRSAERRNSEGGIMNAVAKQLTDAEIKALADYISGLK